MTSRFVTWHAPIGGDQGHDDFHPQVGVGDLKTIEMEPLPVTALTNYRSAYYNPITICLNIWTYVHIRDKN